MPNHPRCRLTGCLADVGCRPYPDAAHRDSTPRKGKEMAGFLVTYVGGGMSHDPPNSWHRPRRRSSCGPTRPAARWSIQAPQCKPSPRLLLARPLRKWASAATRSSKPTMVGRRGRNADGDAWFPAAFLCERLERRLRARDVFDRSSMFWHQAMSTGGGETRIRTIAARR